MTTRGTDIEEKPTQQANSKKIWNIKKLNNNEIRTGYKECVAFQSKSIQIYVQTNYKKIKIDT